MEKKKGLFLIFEVLSYLVKSKNPVFAICDYLFYRYVKERLLWRN